MTTHEELGAMIREARLEKSMSLGQLASAIGRSSSSVRRWERGEVMPAVSVLPKLAAILEIDPDDFKAAASSVSDHDVDGRVSTVEQPIIDNGGQADPGTDDQPAQVAEPERGLLADTWRTLTSGGRGWIGWLRGLLTAGVLIVMLFVLLWAVGEFFDAIGAVLDSFDVGSNGTQNP